jgi:hypothetical protein
VEIKIGMRQTNREIVLDSDRSREEVGELVAAALSDGALLTLDDTKGRRVMVPAEALAYVELGEEQTRRVGFGVV